MSGRPGKGEGVVYFSEKHNPGGKLKHPGGSILVGSENDPPAGERDTSWLQADKVVVGRGNDGGWAGGGTKKPTVVKETSARGRKPTHIKVLDTPRPQKGTLG